ncbi:spore germination protein [Bacillus sonorensis]|uniref:Spore germination protein YndD n=2 Tax=Bacillus sonorensis TaxID=119858 RepID=M5P730_9BACI|nr:MULTISPECIES: spore germination protein [Bacillus]TWK84433.1 Spore germination protein B1 [Bacillus paralicheniformis]ASB88959.1 putative membrane protein YndD [Bacillus sonorensis]EME75816.1 spore germination protein YndD [Bacillus sonorensis L12]MBG9914933.1 spore gernimation protein [Bacillus sonorensis]MCF7618309.1 spore germination protein [Bacillus sonorensis]
MRWWKSKTRRITNQSLERRSTNKTPSQESTGFFTGDFDHDLKVIKTKIGHNSDVHFREFDIGRTGTKGAIVFIDGLSDKDLINKHIMKSLMADFSDEYKIEPSALKNSLIPLIKKQILPISELTEIKHISELAPEVLIGSTALLIDGSAEVFILGTAKGNKRNIEEPVSEALVRGARVGFTEALSTNTALLRQQGKNESLTMIQLQVGKRAVKRLVIAYIEELAESELVEEVKKRIQQIDIDNVPESGYIEQLIEDNYLSPFPQAQSTERPDRVMSALMEGRVAILLDGTPFVLIVPVTFSMMLQSPEDYYERWFPSSFIRILRFGAAMISLLGPALYISFISFHPGLIPSELAISITGTRVGVPFPSLIEALIMEVAIEILREAGLRLPKPIGQTIGIVGGLIIGEAAVQAGIVSPIMVIVVAVTAISSFAIPQYSAGISLRMLRFVAMFCAGVFGLYGVIMFFLMLASHAVKLKSFGVPYASPAVPYRLTDWKDFIIRMPISVMKRRPKMMKTNDSSRK